MIRNHTMAIALLSSGCLYDGEGTAGLPCNVDADCSAQQCVDHICGGEAAAVESGFVDSDGDSGSGSDDDDAPTAQEFEDACQAGTQACVGSNAISVCSDDGQLRSFACEASCGMGNAVQGGCQTDPRDGVDYCWCESTNGPPNSTCGTPCSSDFECAGHERCFAFSDGSQTCGPSACQSCFDGGTSCQWFGHNCSGAQCT